MPPADTFRIAVLGDFSGDSVASPLRALQIDRDNFSQVMKKLQVGLNDLQFLPDSPPESIQFAELDDFHPDQLVDKLAIFSSLRILREQLQAPETAAAAMRELASWMQPKGSPGDSHAPTASQRPLQPATGHDAATGPATSNPATSNTATSNTATSNTATSNTAKAAPAGGGENLLDSILQSHETEASVDKDGAVQGDPWTSWISSLAAPYAEDAPDPRHAAAIEWLDGSMQAIMQRVLLAPKFQQLESRWRALHQLVHRLETGPDLKIFVLDIDREQLQAQAVTATDISQTPLWKCLVTDAVDTEGGEPWSLLVGDYYFGTTPEDIALLAPLARIAEAIDAPLVAGAAMSRFKDVSEPAWQQFRHSSSAGYVGLVWPRYLARLPYGPHTKPIEGFQFDELEGLDAPRLLWGNSAFLCGLVLGQLYRRQGWELDLGTPLTLDNFPLWIHEQDGETAIHPVGEKLLSDTAAEQLVTLGIMPVVSVRDQDRLRLPWLVSLRSQPLRCRTTNSPSGPP